jgi:2-amino-4-hydroxy-6-hydroxymethyldihydropteridine diphosphokinase
VTLAYIGIGSNQGNARENVERAISALQALGTVTKRSRFYRTKPWGETEQPDFSNAVVALETSLAARALLEALKKIEGDMGRTPTYRWGPRAIDLDILTFGVERIGEPDLVVPHPHLAERAFVLVPLAEIDPSYKPLLDRLLQSTASEREAVVDDEIDERD